MRTAAVLPAPFGPSRPRTVPARRSGRCRAGPRPRRSAWSGPHPDGRRDGGGWLRWAIGRPIIESSQRYGCHNHRAGNEVFARVTSGHGTRGGSPADHRGGDPALLLGREPGQVPRRRRRAGAPAAGAQGALSLEPGERRAHALAWTGGAATPRSSPSSPTGSRPPATPTRRVALHDRRIKTVELTPAASTPGVGAGDGLRPAGRLRRPDAERAGHARPPAHQDGHAQAEHDETLLDQPDIRAAPAGWPPSAPASTGRRRRGGTARRRRLEGALRGQPPGDHPAQGRACPHARRVQGPGLRPGRRDQGRSEGGQGRCQRRGQGGQGRCQGPGVGGSEGPARRPGRQAQARGRPRR